MEWIRQCCRGLLALFCFVTLYGQDALAIGESPFLVTMQRVAETADAVTVQFHFTVPAGHVLYADKIQLSGPEAVGIEAVTVPVSKRKKDVFTEEDVAVFDHDVVLLYRVRSAKWPVAVFLSWQGCSEELCFLPEKKEFVISPDGKSAEEGAGRVKEGNAPDRPEEFAERALEFIPAASTSGYLDAEKFVVFLDSALTGREAGDRVRGAFLEHGILAGLFFILLGGLALNLTPCVLPMIPVNIAIIGAGVQSGSRSRGFLLGVAYGLGITVAYGVLGLAAVFTSARFGTLNSSPYFNMGVAVIFILLSLAMFGVFNLDFTRFQPVIPGEKARRGGFGMALFLGGLSALLAGACVAPVVISVLLLAGDLYQKGQILGLFLPFLLGAGMALPWPFAGAGFSFLPKPGAWMERVKKGFGVLILVVAVYYGQLGFGLWMDRSSGAKDVVAAAVKEGAKEGWFTELAPALREAAAAGKPVFIDFWASWCKNCLKMEKTTFRDPRVQASLERFVMVKFQAEDMGNPEIRRVLDQYEVVGLPTYVVLMPRKAEGAAVP